jgi:hypothetical protein
LNAGDQLRATVTPNGSYDVSIYLVSNCSDVNGSCISGSDQTTSGAEVLTPVVQTSGTYYLIVDGYGGASGTGTVQATISHGDVCTDAYRIQAPGGVFQGTTTSYGADLGTTSASGSCTGFSQAGSDAVYQLTLAPGETLSASLHTTWDSALYLVSDCTHSATTCLVGQDDGDPEELSYTNSGANSKSYFLIVDSWHTGATYAGAYTLTVTIQ